MITNSDQKILITLLTSSGEFRSKIEKLTAMNRQTFHYCLMRLILSGFVKVEQVKGLGNPTRLHLTEDGKTIAKAFQKTQ